MESPGSSRRWRGRLFRVVLALLGLLAAVNLLFGTLEYVEVATADPADRCALTYLETFDDGRVLDAERVAFPPSIKCRLQYPPTGEVYVTSRPMEPVSALLWTVGSLIFLVALAVRFIRRPK